MLVGVLRRLEGEVGVRSQRAAAVEDEAQALPALFDGCRRRFRRHNPPGGHAFRRRLRMEEERLELDVEIVVLLQLLDLN
jgi:hypothetical protein